MLTAASNRDGFPALFQLALEIVSQERHLPAGLQEHLERVVEEALAIVADPSIIQQNTMPEAIQLAMDLRRSNRLKSELLELQHHPSSPVAARSILRLERKLAATR